MRISRHRLHARQPLNFLACLNERTGQHEFQISVGFVAGFKGRKQRHGLFGELREELGSGTPAPRQTTLQEWLDMGARPR